ncbi:MAG: hypothetical protein R3B99_03265 [Polyangiales bacterium]
MPRIVPVLLALAACTPKLAPSEEALAFEQELEDVMAGAGLRRTQEWRTVALDDARLAYIDIGIPRSDCRVLVVLTDGEGEILELRREPYVSLGAPGVSWFPVCADDPGPRSVASTVVARAPMSRAIHLAIYEGPGREAIAALARSYLPEPAPLVPAAPSPPRPAPAIVSDDGSNEVAAPAEPEGPCGADARATALESYAEGRESAERGDLDAAAEAFDRAYACVPDGTILFNAAAVHARRGDARAAVERYVTLIEAHGDALTRVMRRQVDDALAALRRPVRVNVESPAGFVVTIGGVVLDRGEGRVVPGTYEIVWRRGETRETTEVQVRPGERLRVPPPEGLR